MLLGSEHMERYNQMEAEINFRATDFWFMRSPDAPDDEELNYLVNFLLTEFMHVGPFGAHFVREHHGHLKPMFYGIPLQHVFAELHGSYEGMAFVANNPASSVLMKGCFDYLRQAEKRVLFQKLGMSVIAVQRARSSDDGVPIVVGMDYLRYLSPLSIYEHPTNGRLLMALQGEEVPDSCALLLSGSRIEAPRNIHDLYMEASALYNDHEMGEIDKAQLTTELFKLYKG